MKLIRSSIGLLALSVATGAALVMLIPVLAVTGEYHPYDPPPVACYCTQAPPEYEIGPGCPPGMWEMWSEYFEDKIGIPCSQSCGMFFDGCYDPIG